LGFGVVDRCGESVSALKSGGDGARYCGSVRRVGQETDGTAGWEYGWWDGLNSFGAYQEVSDVHWRVQTLGSNSTHSLGQPMRMR
jgi:hypothetical protein